MDSLPLMAALGLLLLVGVAVLVFGLRRSGQSDTVEERLAEFATLERPPTLEEIEMAQPFTERILLPVLRKLAEITARFTPRSMTEGVQHKLDLAGNPYGWGPMEFLGIRVLVMILFGGLGILLLVVGKVSLVQRTVLLIALVFSGFYFPTLLLTVKTRRRQHEITKSLPDALDLLTICVEAGLGFDQAMLRVAQKWEDDLSLAFMRVLQEIQLGKLRREALREMSDRMEVPDVATFVAAIIQAEQLGVSIARVLRIQSDQMRLRRRQRAEELARASQVKILPPVVFLIFPAILVILLGPAIITLKNMPNLFGF
jgi:tight adherence protein C